MDLYEIQSIYTDILVFATCTNTNTDFKRSNIKLFVTTHRSCVLKLLDVILLSEYTIRTYPNIHDSSYCICPNTKLPVPFSFKHKDKYLLFGCQCFNQIWLIFQMFLKSIHTLIILMSSWTNRTIFPQNQKT